MAVDKKPSVYFRADGNSQIGLGHVIRSLALADMLKTQFELHFIIRNPLPALRLQILEVCQNIIELNETSDNLQEAQQLVQKHFSGNEIVVLDGYDFKTAYQQIIKDAGTKLVCIDDIHAYHFVADLIINHAGAVKPADYSAEPYTNYCLGFAYALLRKPFRDFAKNRKPPYETLVNKQVFICLGGADPNNQTQQVVLDCLKKHPEKEYFVVVGSGYNYLDELNTALRNVSSKVKILSNISGEEMLHYMQLCQEAITSPSTISYEYLSIGGLLYLIQIADNQKDIIKHFIAEKLAYPVADFGKYQVQKLSENIFDGQQAKRFQRAFLSLLIEIKTVDFDNHVHLIHQWINDKITRENSFSSEAIPFENHSNWLKVKIGDPNCVYYIFELEGTPCGQLRFDIKNTSAVISYLLAPAFRGRGLGYCILKKGIEKLIRNSDFKIKKISGLVKEENVASTKIFTALGFSKSKSDHYQNALKYSLAI